MIQLSHILVLSQPELIERNVRAALSGAPRGFGFRRRRLPRR